MSLPYSSDCVPSLMPFFGNDTGARDISGLIVRFTGYMITDWRYAKFRAQAMALIHKHMANGCSGVDLIQHSLNYSFQYNETHALWLIDDLHAWGFTTRPWFLEDGGYTNSFMSVGWGDSPREAVYPFNRKQFNLSPPKSDAMYPFNHAF